jgi:DNA invertase Pin-like site-specific DNA recombinase
MRVALYCRCSTSEQSVDPQLDALRRYAEARGLEISKEYLDVGVSGTRDRRTALNRLMKDARKRRFDAVACVKLDRLARSVRHLTSMAEEFESLGIDLIAVDQSLDTSTPSGRLLFHVLGAIAEFERDLIVDRTKAGVEAARRRGRHPGRPQALDQESRERAFRLRRAGKSYREIAELLSVGRSTVARALNVLAGQGVRRPA